jgi:Protein of unknown function (DUF2442)
MQDPALFFRHTALACFHRRRKYPVLSADWQHEVDDARSFIRLCRASWDDRPRKIIRTAYAWGRASGRSAAPTTPNLKSGLLRPKHCGRREMLYEIKEAVPHPDHTVTVTWSDGAHAKVNFAPFVEKGGVFEALKDPVYFVREMRVLCGGIGLTWPNEVDFSSDGLRHDAFPADDRRRV